MLQKYLDYLMTQKGKNITAYDISGENNLADYVIIQHFNGNLDNKKFAETFMQKFGIGEFPDGYSRGEWIIFDLDRVIIHSFVADKREKYNLDKLWQNKKMDLVAKKSKKQS